MKIIWTSEALSQLKEIKEFISKDNPVIADEFLDNLISKVESIKDFPERGRVVPEFSINNIREIIFKNYRIVYLIKKSSIIILTVFESHRLIKREEINKNL